MSAELFLKGRVQLCCGDSIHFLRDQPDDRYDSIVTDPPYALVSRNAVYDFKQHGQKRRTSGGGFMGKAWDTGETAFSTEFWQQCLRVLKPGGHVVAFSGTRTYHRMACAIEDAGFEIRDQIGWCFGSGFPKSHDVSKGIDRAAGMARPVVSEGSPVKRMIPGADQNKDGWIKDNGREYIPTITAPASVESADWAGWGTALKPAWEPICLARKPLSEKTVAANVLKWGTGAINVDGCRVVTSDKLGGGGEKAETAGQFTNEGWRRPWMDDPEASEAFAAKVRANVIKSETLGRWPANIIHDGSEEVIAAFPETKSGDLSHGHASGNTFGVGNNDKKPIEIAENYGGDAGSAARFFYTAKADSDDRLGSKHPTVKPVDLMQWLVRLVTPKGGLVLDPFAGTGTTAEACFREGMRCMMVERETEYQADIRRRMALVMAGPDERSRESIKAKTAGQPIDLGPLFAGAAE